jgi:transposase
MAHDPDLLRRLLRAGGRSVAQIAAEVGCGTATVTRAAAALRRAGETIELRPGRPAGRNAQAQEIAADARTLREQGLTSEEIAVQIGRSVRAVQGYLSDGGEEIDT